jgi:asparagine synthase (glutamine-hydrolysing)
VIAVEGDLALGRRLFEGGDPPIAAGAGALLVADLRLDNRESLVESLGLAAGLSDEHLLLRALERWGEEAVERLEGDFAFAFWDSKRRRLLLARDFLGQRPLHYSHGPGFFAFASMAKGLHALAEVPMAPDAATVAAFLAQIPRNGRDTFFKDVEKVEPGHIVTATAEGVRSSLWWRPALASPGLKRPEDYAEALRAHLDRAVEVRLRGSDSIGSQLSGGLDSGSVTATAARLLGGRPLTAFTAVPREGYAGGSPREGIADEGPLAAAVAALYPNIEHVLIRNGGSPFAGLDRNFLLYEAPVLNLCNAVWMDRIMDSARDRKLDVLLTGARGNSSFSYDGMPLLSELLAGGRLLRLAREARALLRRGTRVGSIAGQALGPFLPVPLWQAIGRMRGKSRQLSDRSLLSPEAAAQFRIAERAAERGIDISYRPRRGSAEARLAALRRIDIGNHNKGTLAGWGIDVRDPTADRRLVEFCLSVPADQYLRGGIRRALARTAFADRLPRAVVDERRKGYQAADWYEGLTESRDELERELAALEASGEARSILDTARLRRLTEEWPAGDAHSGAVTRTYRLALLRGVSAGHFLRRAAGSGG